MKEKPGNTSSRNIQLVNQDSKGHNSIGAVNTSPDGSSNKRNKKDEAGATEKAGKEGPHMGFIGSSSIDASTNIRKNSSSSSPFANREMMKKTPTNSLRHSHAQDVTNANSLSMKKKIFQYNILARSKDEKYSNMIKSSDLKVSNTPSHVNNPNNANIAHIPNNPNLASSGISGISVMNHNNKTVDTRLFNREYSDQNLLYKNKSKSITNIDRSNKDKEKEKSKDVSQEKTKKVSLEKAIRLNHSVNTKVKYTPIYNFSNPNKININVNMSNSNLIATVKNRKTIKNVSINNISNTNSSSNNINIPSSNTIEVTKKDKEVPIISKISSASASGYNQNANTGTTNTNGNTNSNLNSNANFNVIVSGSNKDNSGGTLSYSNKVSEAKLRTKDGLVNAYAYANVKFIRKDSSGTSNSGTSNSGHSNRPKSATGLRNNGNNVNVYKK